MHLLPYIKKLNQTSELKKYGKKSVMVHYCKPYLPQLCKPSAETPSSTTLLASLQSSDVVST